MFTLAVLPRLSKWHSGLARRGLSTAEVAAALRPFYFSVHPDLFQQYPQQRAINEDSLKQLSAYLASFKSSSTLRQPNNLPFYIRTKNNTGVFRLIKVPLGAHSDPHGVVLGILKSCNLPTNEMENMSKPHPYIKENPNKNDAPSAFDDTIIFSTNIQKERDAESLKTWLKTNTDVAIKRRKEIETLRDEVTKLEILAMSNLALAELRWECGWNYKHYRGCLQSLIGLYKLHPATFEVLKGRVLVFAQFTGISLDGHVMLSSGEVKSNWLELVKNVNTHDKVLRKIPLYENALARVLRNIQIARRKFMPKVSASEYAGHLSRITTSILDYLGKQKYPKHWPSSLNEYEIVIDSQSGPMMVTTTGQIIVPSSCPGSLLVDFISGNLDVAKQNMSAYKANKQIEKSLHVRAVTELKLESLSKDDSVCPEKMIECLQRLLDEQNDLKSLLESSALHVTNYYSVLGDGTVCIPWDWK